MSWVSDVIDEFILKLQDDGKLMDLVQHTSILKGMEPDFPDNLAQNKFPAVRVTWVGTEEETEPGDDNSERAITLSLEVRLAVRENKEVDRLEALADLEERVKNAIYRGEDGSKLLVSDEINVTSTEVAPDLFPPFGLAIMDVSLMSWVVRDGRTGR